MERVRLFVVEGEPNQLFVQQLGGQELLPAIHLTKPIAEHLLEWLTNYPMVPLHLSDEFRLVGHWSQPQGVWAVANLDQGQSLDLCILNVYVCQLARTLRDLLGHSNSWAPEADLDSLSNPS